MFSILDHVLVPVPVIDTKWWFSYLLCLTITYAILLCFMLCFGVFRQLSFPPDIIYKIFLFPLIKLLQFLISSPLLSLFLPSYYPWFRFPPHQINSILVSSLVGDQWSRGSQILSKWARGARARQNSRGLYYSSTCCSALIPNTLYITLKGIHWPVDFPYFAVHFTIFLFLSFSFFKPDPSTFQQL